MEGRTDQGIAVPMISHEPWFKVAGFNPSPPTPGQNFEGWVQEQTRKYLKSVNRTHIDPVYTDRIRDLFLKLWEQYTPKPKAWDDLEGDTDELKETYALDRAKVQERIRTDPEYAERYRQKRMERNRRQRQRLKEQRDADPALAEKERERLREWQRNHPEAVAESQRRLKENRRLRRQTDPAYAEAERAKRRGWRDRRIPKEVSPPETNASIQEEPWLKVD